MEEMMMTTTSSPQNSRNETISEEISPSWKLYENPFYYSQPPHQNHHHQSQTNKTHLHRLQLPLSARKIAASFRDLTFFRPIMESELETARAQITELKAELERERRARKKVESANKRLAKEAAEERLGREAIERVCEELAREISSGKAEMDRKRREMEEERKMMRMAEVLREERVQMKLTEAKILLEEKITELEVSRSTQIESSGNAPPPPPPPAALVMKSASTGSIEFTRTRLVLGEKQALNDNISTVSSTTTTAAIQRRASPEAENPHIKRGIKGFVEFPRVVRAIGSKSRHWGSKLECQKAQLRILLKQKSSNIGSSNNLIMS